MASSLCSALWECNTLEKAQLYLKNNKASSLVLRNYVSNSFVSSTSENYINSFNPKTGEVYSRVPISSASDVNHAVLAAETAFKTWSKATRAERSRYLQKIAALIQENRELFAVWESIDQGKTVERARVEVDRAISNFSYFSTYILHEDLSVRMIDGVALTYEHRSPAGVFALISPWNMPLYLLTWKIAPCLAFGCTAVAKPSEVTSITAFLLAEVTRRAGLPSGVLNIVFGDGATTGSELVKHPKVKGISFTGGTATGIQIRKDTAADIYKHLSLELGGKNPTLVFDDVDLEKAVATAAMAAFENQGEICLCGSRIYVQSTIYDSFVKQFTNYVADSYRLGGKVGAVVSLQHYQKIRSYLLLAEKEEGTFHLGSMPDEQPKAGYWIEPTVLTGISTDSRIMKEEIFGPVVTIAVFKDEEEAIELANDNPNGLASMLLTRDGARMRRVGERIEAGLVWVNCWLVRELGTPFGGMKSSGVGREGGSYSRDVFTNVRTLHLPSV
ncbi:putative aldehyde dehydrogenase [Stipitochalara longipes BDJ]|nr:putative aldehyde dehydrogenase [Stipitochalara longipes BDJ]